MDYTKGQEVRRLCEKCGCTRLIFLTKSGKYYYFGCTKCHEIVVFEEN
jgi:hypothetical protein